MTTHQPNTQFTCNTLDVSALVGYPLALQVNPIQDVRPLFWQSFSEGKLLEQGAFLDSPGLPLANLLGADAVNALPNIAKQLSSAFSFMCFELTQAILASREAEELAASAPLLFVYLVKQSQESGQTLTNFQHLVKAPRRQIADWCGLPATKSLVRLLARVAIQPCTLRDLPFIKSILNNDEKRQLLAHTKHPSISHLLFMHHYAGDIWPNLLRLIQPSDIPIKNYRLIQLLEDTNQLGATPQQLKRIANYNALTTLHDTLTQRLNGRRSTAQARKWEAKRHQNKFGDFPSAPLAGNDHITPLTSWYDLFDEGIVMRHCVGSYGPQIARGKVFIYRMTQPQRLTIAIQPAGNRWRIEQVKGFYNQPPTKDALNVIYDWLAGQ